jgi:hypothetical protein
MSQGIYFDLTPSVQIRDGVVRISLGRFVGEDGGKTTKILPSGDIYTSLNGLQQLQKQLSDVVAEVQKKSSKTEQKTPQ